MSVGKHPNKAINKAIKYAESKGWRIEHSNGHPFAKMYCPLNQNCRGGKVCYQSIWSTPRKPEQHAEFLRSIVDKCEGKEDA